MQTAKRLEGINEYYFSQKLREIDDMNKNGKNVINLGIGSPDLPPHGDVIRTLNEESIKPNVHAYQNYKGSPILRNAMSAWYKKWYRVDLNADTEILPLIGSKEGIMHICMTYLDENSIALIPDPGYPTYRSAATLAQANIINYNLTKERNWFPDLDQVLVDIDSFKSSSKKVIRNVVMFVNYPHMPTGQLPTLSGMTALVSFAKSNNILLVHDNPYSFILNKNPLSLLEVEDAKDVVLELNSLSKSHNMAGWRVGMLCGASERILEVLKFKSNMDSGMFLPLQLAAATALTLDAAWYEDVNQIYSARQKKVFELLNLLDCKFEKDQAGMFVWAAIPGKFSDGFEMADSLLQGANVFITPGGIFGENGNQYVRVSLCAPEEKIDSAIERIVKYADN